MLTPEIRLLFAQRLKALRKQSHLTQKRGYSSCPTKSINAQAIENTMVDHLRRIFSDMKKIENHPYKQEIEALLSPIWDTLYPQEKRRIFKALVKEIDYNATNKKLGIILNGSDLRLEYDVEFKQVRFFNKWHKEKEVTKEPQIRKILILAHQIQRLVNKGKIKHPRNACEWLNLSVTRMDQIMNTLFLCPTIQDKILSTNTPAIGDLTEFKIRPLLKEAIWDNQLSQWQKLTADNKER